MGNSLKKLSILLIILGLRNIFADRILEEEITQLSIPNSIAFPKKEECELTLGYLALSEGISNISNLIELVSTSNWSHVCMIFCPPTEILKPDLHTNNFAEQFRNINKKNWYCLDIQPEYPDTRLLSWDYLIKQKENTASFVLRAFNYHSDYPEHETIEKVTSNYVGIPYKKSKLELLLQPLGLNSKRDKNSISCSELTAVILEDLNLLQTNKLENNYLPADFSTQSIKPLTLMHASLCNEFKVPGAIPGQAYPQDANRGKLRNLYDKILCFLRLLRRCF